MTSYDKIDPQIVSPNVRLIFESTTSYLVSLVATCRWGKTHMSLPKKLTWNQANLFGPLILLILFIFGFHMLPSPSLGF